MRLIVLRKGLGAGLSGWFVPGLLVLALGGCTIAKPRTDDPWEGFNRKMYVFNDAADKAVIRPVAAGYRKVTTPNVRRVVSNFYDNIKIPITIANNVLQCDPKRAAKSTGRFLINTTLGFVGLFDPACVMDLPLDEYVFGVTVA
jgi:phospholipid-binding lipoprotein MlaA